MTMNQPLTFALAAAIVSCAIPVPAMAAADTKSDAAKAGDRCEEAVAETVRRMRGRDAQEVEFVGAKRAIAPAPDADETGVKGEGRYRSPGGTMSFSYSCAFNARTGGTSGVMFRETGGTRSGSGAAWEPDLTHFSPEACETAAASQLKQKYPRVGRIAFGSDSRQLRPAADAHTSVEGQGAVQRAPGMNSIPFRYRCEIETRSGKVVSVTTQD
ncbi:hypothetical protein [Piscinibacter sp. XHJ-5]|uniref:hypothetical protein n=1 Tax=Piscinibacter sp. XHJ-5 TaxID=3037797 RepID=UPI002452A1C3|nr:hypothetical protein [Piscinibacter sp. XHJ-5]